MELREAVLERRSIRQFLAEPVSEQTIREIVADALWSPSWGNTQCWEIVVGTGEALETFKRRNRDALLEGRVSTPDVPMPENWPDRNLQRYRDLGRDVLGALGIPRGDRQARLAHFGRMFHLFDAPAVVVFTVEREIALEYAMLDLGILIQTFCLLAHGRGLGTCIMAAVVNYPEIGREVFSIPEGKRLVMGAALGWPDRDAPVNRFERQRGSLEDSVRWVR